MKLETYYSMSELTVDVNTIKEIVDLLCKDKEQERKVDSWENHSKIHIIYCDCSDGEIGHAHSAAYNEKADVIFLDKDCRGDLEICRAHELIHYLQKRLYLWFTDELCYEYRERWNEVQAFKFAEKVAKILTESKFTEGFITEDEEEIYDYLESAIKKNEKEKAKKRKKIAVTKSVVDLYYEENENRNRDNW